MEMAAFRGTQRFEVRSCLGAGGMGIVYEVRDRVLGRSVAAKTLRKMTPRGLVRFKREFRALRDLRHPNLVRFGELYEDQGQWFFTMELLRGGELLDQLRVPSSRATTTEAMATTSHVDGAAAAAMATVVDEPTSLRPAASAGAGDAVDDAAAAAPVRTDWQQVRRAFAQLFSGLAALHAAGKVHRDIKPSNVWLTSDERVVLLDFGLVLDDAQVLRGARAGAVTGTAAYMAPEQAAGERPTAQADCYAAGVVLYEALTGTRPFVGTMREILHDKQRRDAPTARLHAGDLPADLVELVELLLRRDPRQRPSAGEVLRRLDAPRSDAAADSRSQPSAGASRRALIGRDNELAELRALYDDTCARDGATAVLLHGAPGSGKRALVEQLLADLASSWEPPQVLRSRCVERERIPFQALDALVDGLCDVLLRRAASADLDALVAPLARTFPQLLPLLSADALAAPLQRQGARALSELMVALGKLLSQVARARPLLLYVQDLHRIDDDSLTLLSELVVGAEQTRLLLVGTLERASDDDARRAAEVAARFGGGRRLDPSLRSVHHVLLEPLDVQAARALFVSRCEQDGLVAEHAHALACELLRDRASPLVVCELAHAASHAQLPAGRPALDLDALLLTRFQARAALEQRLLELLALAAAPLTVSMLAAAVAEDSAGTAEGEVEVARALAALELDGLVAPARRGRWDAFEPRHRALASVARRHVSARRQRQVHEALLLAQRVRGELDAEALAVHLEGAGRLDEAAEQYERAAELSLQALAFTRAAQLFESALAAARSLGGAATTRGAAWQARLDERLAEALIGAGRCSDAARALLRASRTADGEHAAELRRRAAEQLLRAGRTDEALEELHPLLAELGLSMPRSMPAAMLSLLLRRVALRLRGLERRTTRAGPLDARSRARLDTCWAVAATVGLVDIVRGSDFQARHLELSLQAGDPYRIGRALALEAGYMAADPARRGEALRTLDRVAALVPQVENPEEAARLEGFFAACCAFVELQRGFWRSGAMHADRAAKLLRERCHGVDWEVDTAEMVGMWCHAQLGTLGELGRRVRWACREAERRGDVHAATNLRVGLPNLAWLAADDVEGARAASEQARPGLASSIASWQRAFDVLARANIDLYAGEDDSAHRRVEAEWSSLLRDMQLSVQLMRSLLTDLRGRAALAVGARHIVELAVTRLSRQQRWCRAHAAALEGGLARAGGQHDAARARYAQAAELYEGSDMALHALCARWAAARAGDDDSAAFARGVAQLGIAAPPHMLRMLFPAER